eukprot:TRINITY_DN16910_c0_g2_i1.p1 TRINITY_DN16910_c0_g2~~TRINITY_DN16910_c0_g2_i1.p1  ORF type:complete len:117 (+),score=37.78 TRINITY_DN16910_c0_g2_i1:309-659(+)
MLEAKPTLLEPIHLVQVRCPEKVVEDVYLLLDKRKGFIIKESNLGDDVFVDAYVPVGELVDFDRELGSCSLRTAVFRNVFSHWRGVQGDPLQLDTPAYKLVSQIRKRKGLPPEILN